MGFKLPKDLEQIAAEHGLSKEEVEQFADDHNITGLKRGGAGGGGGAPTKTMSPADMMQQAYASNTAVTSDRELYARKKDKKAEKKDMKGDRAMAKAHEARMQGKDKKADRLEARASRKYAKADKKRRKASDIRDGPHW